VIDVHSNAGGSPPQAGRRYCFIRGIVLPNAICTILMSGDVRILCEARTGKTTRISYTLSLRPSTIAYQADCCGSLVKKHLLGELERSIYLPVLEVFRFHFDCNHLILCTTATDRGYVIKGDKELLADGLSDYLEMEIYPKYISSYSSNLKLKRVEAELIRQGKTYENLAL